MKTAVRYFIVIIALFLASCQNNGNIGDLFGTWRVDEYTVDGVIQTNKVKQTTFSFQSGVVYVAVLLNEYQQHIARYGTWVDNGDTFILNFTHFDDSTPQGTDIYAVPEWLGMTSEEVIIMKVDKHTSSDMEWSWIDDKGVTRIYKLHKTW